MKKIISLFAAAAVLIAGGCSGGDPAQTSAVTQDLQTGQTTDDEYNDSETDAPVGGENTETTVRQPVSGYRLSVEDPTGKMSVERAPEKSTPMGDEDTWTIFVYLCGTDLESDLSMASLDIYEMGDAEASENVKFVVQTGGTSQWTDESFRNDVCQRWVVTDGGKELADSVPLANMGDPATLESFLEWGVENYPADKMGVVFWDHGGGSITGVCFDELYESDSLSLAEINTALSDVYDKMTDKFEFIGFDCCLMATAETANILATYARYLYASQELVTDTGWDYQTIGTYLAQNPECDGGELGQIVADSYFSDSAEIYQDSESTFSVMDLEKTDDFIKAFNDYAYKLYDAAQTEFTGIVRGINKADNFGGNTETEGYTNMVDIGSIIEQCSQYADGTEALSALRDCIVYIINGSDHPDACGLSIYFPLAIQGSKELSIFSGICISPYYLSLVDMEASGYASGGYSNSALFTEDGKWTENNCVCETCEAGYFSSSSDIDSSESELIVFAEKPHINESGIYTFRLEEESLNYTESVNAYIYLENENGDLVELGETNDIYADWDEGVFEDYFDGYWLGLGDGQILAAYVVDETDEYTIFTSPVKLNGTPTNLRIRVYFDQTVIVDGTWDGVDENGVAARKIYKLTAGDKIEPLYYLEDETVFSGSEYLWEDSGKDAGFNVLPVGDYYYGFYIYDVYGDYCPTDYVVFTIDEEGNIYFYGDEDGNYSDSGSRDDE